MLAPPVCQPQGKWPVSVMQVKRHVLARVSQLRIARAEGIRKTAANREDEALP